MNNGCVLQKVGFSAYFPVAWLNTFMHSGSRHSLASVFKPPGERTPSESRGPLVQRGDSFVSRLAP